MISDKQKPKLMSNIPYNYATRPKALCNSSTKIKKILRSGNAQKIEKLIRDGYGYKLIGETSPIPKIRAILKAVPFYMARIDMLHEAVVKGQLRDIEVLLNTSSAAYSVLKPKPENLVESKDSAGIGLLHKAVFYDYPEIIEWLVKNYPSTVHIRDKLGRIPLHYVNSTSEPDKIWELLVSLGSDINTEDVFGKTPLYYLSNDEEVQLPDKPSHAYKPYGSEVHTIKPSNIRIWIHDQDIGKLQQVIWDGHGDKLRMETSNKPLMRKFLNGVPYIMGVIQEIHKAVITDEINKLKLNSRNPIPPVILSSKDANGLTPLHKAAGLGHNSIVEYILNKYPNCIHIGDSDGRTALHYAASFKKNETYDILLKFGANENIIDKFGKTAKCFQSKTGDIDSEFLYEIPSAPRIGAANGYPSTWDWSILQHPLNLNTHKTLNNFNEKVSSAESNNKKKNNKIHQNDTSQKNIHTEDHLVKRILPNSDDSSNIENENVSEFEGLKCNRKDENDNEYEKETVIPDQPEKSINGYKEECDNFADTEFSIPPINDKHDSEEEPIISILHNEFDKIFDNYQSPPQEEFTDEIEVKNKLNVENHVEQVLNRGNLEEIGNLILEGWGEFLIHKKSQNPEIQEFINNLPIHLKKIEIIHHCCEIGNLEELQKYLDRKKLVIARENKTGLYLTPLHIAVINNHRDIARYLGGRFPETFKVKDRLGRTPLHFASIHPNGQYIYSMLVTLGADKNVKDSYGNTPEFYYYNRNNNRFHELQLIIQKTRSDHLSELGSSIETEKISAFLPSENKYLSTDLEKAIKTGLSAMANENPVKPIKFLANYLNNYNEEEQKNFLRQNSLREHHQEEAPLEQNTVETVIPKEVREVSKEVVFDEDQTFHSEYQEDDEDETISDDEIEMSQTRRNSIIDYGEKFGEQFQPISRDKHGQTIVHFAAARTHSRNALLQTLRELDVNIAYRDELYRTARDIAVFSELYDNVKAIDAYVLQLGANGQTDKLLQLLVDGYDHILELESPENIIDVARNRNHKETLRILETINIFEETREDLHGAIRKGNKELVREIFKKCGRDAMLMAKSKNDTSRCSLHIAVLSEHKDIVKLIVRKYPETLKIGDNLDRTALHYAMGLQSVEELSRLLIKAGAERVIKDLKGRQPSYYFMNNTEILQMQQEEMFFGDQLGSRRNKIKSQH